MILYITKKVEHFSYKVSGCVHSEGCKRLDYSLIVRILA